MTELTTHRPRRLFLLRALTVALAGAALVTSASGARAQMSREDLMQLSQSVTDTATAASMIPKVRGMIASAPDSIYAGVYRQMLLRALITSNAPMRAVALAADSIIPYLNAQPEQRAPFFASVAQVLADRGGDQKTSMAYARRGLRELGPNPDVTSPAGAFVYKAAGFVHMKYGSPDTAITYFNQILPASADSQAVLRYLGEAYARKGRQDAAITSYVRSVAVFPGHDTTGIGALRAAYIKRYGTVRGLDARIEAARSESRTHVALEPRRQDTPAPAWKLVDLDGKPVESASLAGKIVVMDFWGSWCGPCRRELPLFDALYQHHRDDARVRFIGVNWEREKDRHAELARDYMTQNHLTFPVVIDPEQSAVQGFNVQAFPTVFIIDATGRIRFQNVGVAENIDEIIEAQVESLLE